MNSETKKSKAFMGDVGKKISRSQLIIALLSGAVLLLSAGFCYLLYEYINVVEEKNLLEVKNDISSEIVEKPCPPQNQFMFECDSFTEESQKWDHVIPVKIVWKNLTDREVNATQKKLSTGTSLYNFTLTSSLEITLYFSLYNNDEPLPFQVDTIDDLNQQSRSFILSCPKLSQLFESRRNQQHSDPLTAYRLQDKKDMEKKEKEKKVEVVFIVLVVVVMPLTALVGLGLCACYSDYKERKKQEFSNRK